MKTKILKLLTLVTGLAMGQAFAAGNLFEILPCNSAGETQAAKTATDTPLVAGEKVYFKLRLARTATMVGAGDYWNYTHVGSASDIVDELVHPLKIGIIVSGELRYATYVTNTKATNNLQDFVFEYVTKPGDFALPIRLALKDGNSYIAAGYDQTSPEYVWLNADKWAIRNAAGLDADFTILQTSDADYAGVVLQRPETGARKTDYSLINAGFYVQTVGFGKKWEEVDANNDGVWWRKVHEGSTVTESLTPCLEMDSVAEDAVTLYVWSKDENSVKIFGGETVNMKVDTAGTMKDVQVGTITIAAGQLSANFQIEGVTRDTSTELVLSSFKGYTFNQGANAMVPDFRTVKVKCTEPLPPTLKITADTTEAIAGSARYAYAAQLSVSLSEAYDKDLTVTITPSFSDGAGDDDIGTYMALSRNPSATTKPAATTLTVTIPANSTAPQTAYLYAFRSDARTLDENQIVLTPSVSVDDANKTEAEAWLQAYDTLGLNIVAMQPVITTPSAGAKYGTTCNEEMPVTISVDDTYAAWTDDTTGYEIWFKADDTTNFAKLDGTYINDGGELKKLGAGTKPVLVWGNAGEHESEIYVVSPISKKASDPVKVQVTVGPARTVNLEPTDDLKGVYNEGVDSVSFKITLSEANNLGYPIYAFLMPNTGTSPEQFDPGPNHYILDPTAGNDVQADKQGIVINPATGDATTPVYGSFLPLDGGAKPLGLQAYFSVVLCKTPTYDKSQVVTRYSSVSPMNIKVFNTEPTLNDILFAGFPVSGYTDHAYPYAIPKNQEQTIELVADDMGTYDVTQGLPYRWTAESTTGGRGQGTGVFTTTDTDFTFNFPRAGLWTVKVYLRDKDMGANTYIAPFVFTVNVLDQPQVEIEVAESYSESTAKQSVLVKMPIYDADDYIAVKVTVTPPENTNNPGVFKLDSSYKKGRAPNYPDLTAENEYYVFFTSAGEQQLWVETESLDGTVASETKGFILETEVLGDGSGTTGDYDLVTDPDTGAPILWSKYYLTGRQTLSLMNSAPVCEVPVENTSTNAFEVAGGAATSGWIRFMIRDVTADLDVDPDVAAATNFEGVKVTITGCPAGVTQDLNKGTNVATPMEFFVTENGSFNFIPNFAGVQGDQIVTLMIEDKDGSYQSWTYHYKVMPSKFLRLVSNGPGGLATDLSDRYRNAQGRGAGHAYLTSGGTLDETNSKSFITMWNCSRNAAAQAVAWGYKLNNPTDDGSLDGGQDIAIDERGDFWTAGATHYTYTNANGLDSFLYAWLRHVGSEDGLQSTRIAIAPERVEDAAPAVTPIPLPAEETQDGNYQEVYAEAIFSREWRAQDNCGDINQDGVPDRIARETGLLVLEGENADDLANLAGNNDDEDFLPSNTSSGNDIVPNMRENWAVQGNAFTALREIRGWHDGLNRGYNKLGDPNPTPDYSPNEIRAYLLWKGLAALEALAEPTVNGDLTDAIREMFNENNNLTAAAEDLANGAWSPERPTNPTLADTDGDGLEDGYEYWFWYGARVGYSSREPDGRLRWNGPMTGLRFNLTTFEMDEITSDEILAEFDPQSPNANVLLNDFDNDGLSNEEEFLIGTNPVRCDTDGDGNIDGFEVMWGLDPVDVRGTEDQNPDGDAMARLDEALSAEAETLQTAQFVYGGMRYFFLVNTELFPETPPQQDETTYREGLPYFWGTLLGYRQDDGTGAPYNDDLSEVTVDFMGMRIPGPDFGRGLAPQDDLTEALQGNRCYGLTKVDIGLLGVTAQYEKPLGELMLVHDQVYRFLGFDPRTAWCPESPCIHGHLNTRWCGTDHDGGRRVNTAPFTTRDEFYYAQYRRLMNQFTATGRGVLADMVANATIPSVLTTLQRYGTAPEGEGAADNRTAYGSLIHGADSDLDGVADGWAIYVCGDPLGGYARDNANADRDSLSNAGEFFATDILDEYSDCPSISGLNQNGEDADLGDMDGDGQTSNEEQQIEEARKLAAARRAHVWANKFFPTNPGLSIDGVAVDIFAEDTDGDGIRDGAEGEDAAFSYSTLTYEEVIADKTRTCFRGGRLNPCSSDTDGDALPDLWELQYRGTVTQGRGGLRDGFVPEAAGDGEEGAEDGEAAPEIGNWITDGMDGTDGRDATTTGTTDEITGTVRDYDFDGDGLENYQEYLVQAMRAWRYDDAETPLMGTGILWKNNHLDADEDLSDVEVEEGDYIFANAQGYSTRVPGIFPQMNISSGAAFFRYLLDESDVGRDLEGFWNSYATDNDYATTYLFAQHMMYDYAALGYLALPTRRWDPAFLSGTMIMLPPRAMVALMDDHPLRARTSRDDADFEEQDEFEVYVSCDPRSRDTDGDGLDDFWEIFHGLNPLFGAVDADVNGSDIVAGAYGRAGLNVQNNVWTGLAAGAQNVWLDYRRGQGEEITVNYANPDLVAFPLEMKVFDPIRNPWTLGAAEADPDGDGLRNIDEGLFGNMTSPYNYHTDPTPLWMTEPETPVSFVSQYYRRGDFAYPETWGTIANQDIGTNEAATQDFLFAFERTEGCDTDGDCSADNQELIRGVLPVSDPLNSADPDRRAALYLGNDDSLTPEEPACVYSYQEGNTPTLRNGAYDLFRHFTVECWIKPERQGTEQTILERAFAYPAANLQNHQEVLRANFRIALDEAGQVYGLFDNNNATESGADLQNSQKVTALGALPLNTWSHVALAFDGQVLCIYVNGELKSSARTNLIPANGLISISQDPNNTDSYPAADYKTLAGGTTIGARRQAENGNVTFSMNMGFEQFTDFFQGYVSEVRLWDGAHSDKAILENYKKRMSQADIAANRESVYTAWYSDGDEEEPWTPNKETGATRNNNDGKPVLPVQLIALYNFQQLPAAAQATDVATVPFGFSKVVQNFIEDDENTADAEDADLNEELFVGWWNDEFSPLANTVYNDYRVIPWVQNMVSRLPLMDGSFGDSMFWSQEYAGYTPATTHGFNEYGIPNGGNPYKSRNYDFEADLHYWRLVRMAQAGDTRAAALASMFAFEARTQFVGIDELLPLGAAYAKLSPDYWDEGGATTSWVETGVDADGDGLPDWWEAMYGGATVELDTLIVKDGVSMPAWEAYLRDLAAGMQPSGAVNDKFAASADADGDGLVDWWQNIYTITSGADGDDDGDGLANYVEYLLAEVFKLGHFAPDSAFSVNPNVSDYFFKVGESYVGEIFTDHDFVDDRWEDTYRNQDNQVTRHLYDAMSDGEEAGLGGDGWSNYAEFQAGTDPLKSASLGINDDGGNPYIVKEFPVPMVEARIVYNGTQNLNNNPLVVKAWRDETLESQPDATWTIQSAVTAQPDAGAGGDNGNAYEKYLGMNPGKSVVLYLLPGNVCPSSVEISVKDFNYTLHNIQTGEYFFSEPENAEWFNVIGDTARSDGSGKGDIIEKASSAVVGEIDYQTGAVTLDFPKLGETVAQVGIVGQENNDENWETIYNISSSYVRIEYEAPALPNFTGAATYYLGEADAPNGGDVNSFGHVKEGRNTFIAFADLDGNGDYTAGEPFGVAPNVDVGWNHAKLQITLTDTSPVTARFSVGGGNNNAGGDNNEGGDDAGGGNGAATNDRDTLYGTEGGNKPIQEITVGHPSGGKYERVRVVRTLINGAPAYSKENKTQGVVVLDKMMSLENDSYITEADFLRDGQFDIDWATLADDLEAAGNASLLVSNVSYRVVLGNGDVSNLVTNNLLGIVFNRWFDSPEVYANEARPQAEALGEVTSASPTFKWTVPGNLNSYSAFQVRVKDADGATIWNSGFQLTPASTLLANGLAQYVWQAPLFAGAKTPDGQYVFTNGKKYTYQVSLANARYKNSTNWSDEVAFAMNVLTNTTDTGTMKVAVRYFGPTAVANSGVVRVQAFTTPDFSGQPVGEGFVTDVATLSSTAAVTDANATIIGLPEGNYYLRAFVDTETNGLRAAWESWGYACERDMRDCAIFTPKMIKVGPKSGRQDVITVVIEDCDTDKDSLPDAWEWTQKQNLSDLDVLEADFLADSSLVKKSLAEKLSTSAGGTLSSGLSVQLASLHNPYKAAMVLGVDVSNVTDADAAQAAVVSAASTETVEPKTVAITALDFDTVTGQVTIQVEATTESAAASGITANPIYTVETSATVKVVVQKKTQLTDAAWETIATETLTITGEGPIELTPQAISADTTSGFFRVILEK